MLLRVRKSWELPESAATDESAFHQRRQLVKAMGLGSIVLAGGAGQAVAAAAEGGDPSAGLYP